MIVSVDWLKDYVKLPGSTEELTDKLTFSGLNLEGVETPGDDIAIDLEVTSNRPDCLGHIGVAREISVLYDTELKLPEPKLSPSSEKTSEATSVTIECPDACPRYVARLIRGVKIGPSPEWLVKRLATLGINSVNNVVDATNYVMFETGQPFHAFDFAKLVGGKIVVRYAKPGEKIEAIDHQTYELAPTMCVIADAEQPVAVAGVMGGASTEISDKTIDILLETAEFAPLSVRHTARTLKLFSPSQYRFERLVDSEALDWNSQRCAELIVQLAGGEVSDGVVFAGSTAEPREPITLRFAQIERLLGISIPEEESTRILTALGMEEVESNGKGTGKFIPPSWRPDLTREVDLIEEVARIHGYDELPNDAILPVAVPTLPHADLVRHKIREVLTSLGVSEAITLSFVSMDQQQLFNPNKITEPLTVEHSTRRLENVLRTSLIPSLLQCRRENERRGVFDADLFEIAKIYLRSEPGNPEAEPTMLGIVSGGNFGELKGQLETLLETLCPAHRLTARACELEELTTGYAAELFLDDEPIGWMGILSSRIQESSLLDLRDEVTVAELKLEPVYQRANLNRTYEPLPQFPAMDRDINFMLDEDVSWEQLRQTMETSGGELLERVDYVSQFRGSQLGANKKSYVARLVFRSATGTLVSDQVDAEQKKIVDACTKELNAVQR
ncbi:phenylalanine--tRNA ligase subunit beta [Calycomorphotria hydatis]|uniref:Phenylalanine--tRNA ligase beta subunit n=1 Tax=Calycomorphotria hydatis TaxID=2528027 RepID=A0A517TC94_9PLAN|nr:phenylalanine--tRNA ligase subunit beta [Calycomorphotria hydatis]QDT65991.1 Phenylalanine--tRNA ligase beta subunit [Calycomorphotria hydatis]